MEEEKKEQEKVVETSEETESEKSTSMKGLTLKKKVSTLKFLMKSLILMMKEL